jgi:hypothetical protein
LPPRLGQRFSNPYKLSVRDAFRNSAHGVIVKTLAVTDLRKDAAHRYSPCAVVAVSKEVVAGVPAEISTSYVERANLSIRMGSRRFTRLTNGFSKKLEGHAAAVSLYVAQAAPRRLHPLSRTELVEFRMTVNATIWIRDADLSAPIPQKLDGFFDGRSGRVPLERHCPG